MAAPKTSRGSAGKEPSSAHDAARSAHLRYVVDGSPGILRRGGSKRFTYYNAGGRRIANADELERIRRLAIPPAWTDVWICPQPNGHLQATGRDQRGRKQYRYHQQWREVRDSAKYDRMLRFGRSLPAIRRQVRRDLRPAGEGRVRVLATIVSLLETTLIRVGNEEYAKTNGSYGLTTMRDKHVRISGAQLRFEFKGKSGKMHSVDVADRRLARLVKTCRDIPGQELFQYQDETGERRSVDSADVNDYLRQTAGEEFTAKDFRTWAGTLLAAEVLCRSEAPASATGGKQQVTAAVKSVAERLGNTAAICRKCYIHPAIIETYLAGNIQNCLKAIAASSPSKRSRPAAEQAMLRFLRSLK